MCFVSAQSSWEVAQSSYDVCHVSAHSSWEVAHTSYGLCHVSAQSSWEVAQNSYDVCFVSAQSSWKVVGQTVMTKYCDVFCINALLFVSSVRRCKKNLARIQN